MSPPILVIASRFQLDCQPSMANSNYQFVTTWLIPAPLEPIWNEIMAPEEWPTWWRGVERVGVVRPGQGPHGIGTVRDYTWRSVLPYRLQFRMETTRVEPMCLIEGKATGELEGFGCWRLTASAGGTRVRYDWEVVANKWWMRWLAPLARPAFEWNHDVVMEWGRAGLARRVASQA